VGDWGNALKFNIGQTEIWKDPESLVIGTEGEKECISAQLEAAQLRVMGTE
jgi:hypothetical protein